VVNELENVMAATTVVEYVERPCCRCMGMKYFAVFQHMKGGECFRCGATGVDPIMEAVERPMDYAELCAALAARGIEVVRPWTGDYLVDLFVPDEEIEGARQLLAAL
jgi:hypothetical protein